MSAKPLVPGGRRSGGRGVREVRISSPERVMWPDAGITKGDLAAYASPWPTPHGRHSATGRSRSSASPRASRARSSTPRTRRRGVPDWSAHGDRAPTPRAAARPAGRRRACHRCVGDADEHRHVPPVAGPHRATSTTPTSCASTSTRSRAAAFPDAVEAALALREVMAEIGLTAWAKTSGNRGVHVYAGSRPPTSSSTCAMASSASPASSSGGCPTSSPPPGGRRSAASGSSSTSTRRAATAPSPRPTARGRCRAPRSRCRCPGRT